MDSLTLSLVFSDEEPTSLPTKNKPNKPSSIHAKPTSTSLLLKKNKLNFYNKKEKINLKKRKSKNKKSKPNKKEKLNNKNKSKYNKLQSHKIQATHNKNPKRKNKTINQLPKETVVELTNISGPKLCR
jgi:hypothetical protein